jgi:hypothetical protein
MNIQIKTKLQQNIEKIATAHGNNTIWSNICLFSNQLTSDQHTLCFNLINRTFNLNTTTLKNI